MKQSCVLPYKNGNEREQEVDGCSAVDPHLLQHFLFSQPITTLHTAPVLESQINMSMMCSAEVLSWLCQEIGQAGLAPLERICLLSQVADEPQRRAAKKIPKKEN